MKLVEQQEIMRRVEGQFVLAGQLELRLAQTRGQVGAFPLRIAGALRRRPFELC